MNREKIQIAAAIISLTSITFSFSALVFDRYFNAPIEHSEGAKYEDFYIVSIPIWEEMCYMHKILFENYSFTNKDIAENNIVLKNSHTEEKGTFSSIEVDMKCYDPENKHRLVTGKIEHIDNNGNRNSKNYDFDKGYATYSFGGRLTSEWCVFVCVSEIYKPIIFSGMPSHDKMIFNIDKIIEYTERNTPANYNKYDGPLAITFDTANKINLITYEKEKS